jgi:DnaK suppressor protein
METVTDDNLRSTRERLLQRGAELRDRLRRVQDDLGRKREPLPKDAPDAAIVVENDEILAAIYKAAGSELSHIDHALGHLDAGMFGLCEVCGAEIELDRLRVVPYTCRCRSCARDA